MSKEMITLIGIMVPLAGTALGSAMVFFIKGSMSQLLQKLLLGFASGVMLAASIWSLLIPSINMAEQNGVPSWLPASTGFMSGILFLLLLDSIIPHLHLNSKTAEGNPSSLKKSIMLILSVTLHNIPEGMVVGVVFASVMSGETAITLTGALVLSAGIALQNFPEGVIITTPLVMSGISRRRAFFYGLFSGVVEPLGAVLTIVLTAQMVPILPYLLAFAAGAMIYVVVEELIPGAQQGEHSNAGVVGCAIGFTLMMVLDVALA